MNQEYINPAVTIDNIVIRFSTLDKQLEVLTIERTEDPFYEKPSLIGGFIQSEESPKMAIDRILENKIGRRVEGLEFMLPVYSSNERDPRGWVFTIPNIILVKEHCPIPKKHRWVSLNDILEGNIELAFDHNDIVRLVKEELYHRVEDFKQISILSQLLPSQFTIVQLRMVLDGIEYGEQKGISKNTKSNSNLLRFFKNSGNSMVLTNTGNEDMNSAKGNGRKLSLFVFVKK